MKKKGSAARARHTRKAPPGTVLALKPSQALQIKPTTTVAEAAQLMAAKRRTAFWSPMTTIVSPVSSQPKILLFAL